MTQVLQHNYGKSRVTLLQIRAAIKAVKAERKNPVKDGENPDGMLIRKAKRFSATKSRK